MRLVRLACLVTLLSVALSLAGCKKKPTPRIKVAVTIFPIFDLTRRIAGPDADVVLVVPPGRPETGYEPSEADTATVAGAKLGVLVGLGLDDWMNGLLDQGAGPGCRRVVVGDRVPTMPYRVNPLAKGLVHSGLQADPGLAGKPDPHVWLDPQRAALMSRAIAEEMSRADPAHALAYRSRGSALEEDLEKLDRDIEWRVREWGTKAFVAFRPGFGYYADRYHLEVVAVLEPSPGTAPPLRYDQEVLRVIRAKGIAGVFKEPQFSPAPASVVSQAAGIPVGVLDLVGGLPETDSYDKLLRFDTDALERVMKAPPRPLDADSGAAGEDAGRGAAPRL